jgi:D-serine deaminase-like pyridoxal phosphate-dependent protein
MDEFTAWVAESRERVRAAYGLAIGHPVDEAITPALVLDIAALRRNLARMDTALDHTAVTLRPHVKTHKCPDIALLQGASRTVGFCTATVWEAAMLAGAGLDDIFVVNAVVGPQQRGLLGRLAQSHRIAVAADHPDHVRLLGETARAAGVTVGVLVERDTGMRRGGVGSAAAAVALARLIDAEQGLELRGITGYEGHCSEESDPKVRAGLHRAAMTELLGSADAIRAASLPCETVSAGGTRTWALTAATPGVTELQAGTYALMDRFHSDASGGFEPAAYVTSTVLHRHSNRLVIDAGSKTIADPQLAEIRSESLSPRGFDEEHGRFSVPPDERLPIGAVVRIVPGYAPTTVNAFDAYLVADGDTVVDVWPVLPRGPGHHGIANHPSTGWAG